MARTPRQETIVLAANGRRAVPISGRWLLILTNTAALVDVAFDSDVFTPMLPGLPYPAADGHYDVVTFRDLGAGCTVQALFSEDQITDNRGALLPGIAASLVNIEQEISGGVATGQVANLALPASPAAGQQIFAANAARTEVEISAPETNGGFVYLGITAARCSAVDKFIVLYPGGVWWSEREKGAVFGSGSDALEVVNGRQS